MSVQYGRLENNSSSSRADHQHHHPSEETPEDLPLMEPPNLHTACHQALAELQRAASTRELKFTAIVEGLEDEVAAATSTAALHEEELTALHDELELAEQRIVALEEEKASAERLVERLQGRVVALSAALETATQQAAWTQQRSGCEASQQQDGGGGNRRDEILFLSSKNHNSSFNSSLRMKKEDKDPDNENRIVIEARRIADSQVEMVKREAEAMLNTLCGAWRNSFSTYLLESHEYALRALFDCREMMFRAHSNLRTAHRISKWRKTRDVGSQVENGGMVVVDGTTNQPPGNSLLPTPSSTPTRSGEEGATYNSADPLHIDSGLLHPHLSTAASSSSSFPKQLVESQAVADIVTLALDDEDADAPSNLRELLKAIAKGIVHNNPSDAFLLGSSSSTTTTNVAKKPQHFHGKNRAAAAALGGLWVSAVLVLAQSAAEALALQGATVNAALAAEEAEAPPQQGSSDFLATAALGEVKESALRVADAMVALANAAKALGIEPLLAEAMWHSNGEGGILFPPLSPPKRSNTMVQQTTGVVVEDDESRVAKREKLLQREENPNDLIRDAESSSTMFFVSQQEGGPTNPIQPQQVVSSSTTNNNIETVLLRKEHSIPESMLETDGDTDEESLDSNQPRRLKPTTMTDQGIIGFSPRHHHGHDDPSTSEEEEEEDDGGNNVHQQRTVLKPGPLLGGGTAAERAERAAATAGDPWFGETVESLCASRQNTSGNDAFSSPSPENHPSASQQGSPGSSPPRRSMSRVRINLPQGTGNIIIPGESSSFHQQ